jgi:hypothetical protein
MSLSISASATDEGGALELSLLRFTLLLIMLYTPPYLVDLPVRAVAAAMLVVPAWSGNVGGWGVISVLLTQTLLLHWFELDNHQFLIAYWSWCLYIALATCARPHDVSDVARLLLGLTFAFAAMWKIIGGQYADGSFWIYTLLTDPRVAPWTRMVFDSSGSWHNVEALRSVLTPTSQSETAQLQISDALNVAGKVIGVCGIVLETAIAVVFLLPNGSVRRDWARVGLIVSFVVVYIAIPVIGFAWTLIALTLASVRTLPIRVRHALLVLAMATAIAREVVGDLLLGW